MPPPRQFVVALSVLSAAAMLYVGAYQIRAVQNLKCPLFGHGCEAVADAPFARPFGVPDGFIAAGLYGVMLALCLFSPRIAAVRYAIQTIAILATVANVLGVFDMARLGAWCFYCLLTTALAPLLVWAAFLL
jgi:uncharacterized membrane protein